MTMDNTVLSIIGGAVALLTVATLVGMVLESRADESARDTMHNLNARTRSWWVMVAVFGGAILLGPTAIIVLFAFLSFVALREFWTLTPSRRGDHLALFMS